MKFLTTLMIFEINMTVPNVSIVTKQFFFTWLLVLPRGANLGIFEVTWPNLKLLVTNKIFNIFIYNFMGICLPVYINQRIILECYCDFSLKTFCGQFCQNILFLVFYLYILVKIHIPRLFFKNIFHYSYSRYFLLLSSSLGNYRT